jgi:glucose/arabinose dehydrogenase
LNDLASGSYDIRAQNVTAGGVVYVPTPAAQTIAVTGGSTARATVTYASTTFTLRAQQVVEGLASPVYLTAPKDDPRLFIVEQAGRIRIVKSGALLATPFLDITARVVSGGERGLLSLAFDPAYATNGRFYVYYTGAQGDIFADRFTVSGNPDVANTTSDRVITIQHRANSNHNGGLLLFGPDGMLYLGTGDGGGAGDVPNNAQNTDVLLGKILRLNVAALPYTIPAGNPFVGQAGADEIWAYGLRNPWRYAFDVPPDGTSPKLYIADVGQGAREEVDVVDASAAGRNYGWRIMEGTQCYNPSSGCNQAGLTLPILDYDHGQGCSITGGFVYRGAAMPEVRGHYFYSDYCSGWLRSFRLSGGVAVDQRDWPIGNIGNVTSFGVDGAGELYVLSTNGRAYRLVKQ